MITTPSARLEHLIARGFGSILERAAAEHFTTPYLIASRDRSRSTVRARHKVFRELHGLGLGVTEIGRAFGVDQSSVRYAVGLLRFRPKKEREEQRGTE